MKMMGKSIPSFASWLWNSNPPTPGRRTSRTMQEGTSGRSFSRNESAESNVSTFRPTDRKRLCSDALTGASSSITNTIDSSVDSCFISPRQHQAIRCETQLHEEWHEQQLCAHHATRLWNGKSRVPFPSPHAWS